MCMVGTIANIQDNSFENKFRLEVAIRTMLKGMSEMNKDGTGVAFATTEGNVFMSKSKNEGKVFAETFTLDGDLEYKHFIMHTRMATHGAVTDENAHPHESKFGYLVHNGWCPSLYTKHKAEMKTGCDSEALALVYNPDPAEFEKGLIGSEHFAIIHLDSDGSKVHVMNKNKMLYKAHSKTLSADIFLTSSYVIKEVGKAIGEELDYRMVKDGEVFTLDGSYIAESTYKFKDSGYGAYGSYYEGGWYDYSSMREHGGRDYRAQYYNQQQKFLSQRSSAHDRGIGFKNRRKDDSLPSYVQSMTRKERKRWIKENKERRDNYIQFWVDQEKDLLLQEQQEKEFREDGFLILDADGNVIEES